MTIHLTPAMIDEQILGLEQLLTPASPAAVVEEQRPQAQGDLLFVPGGQMPHWAQPIIRPVTLVATGNGHVLEPRGEGIRWAGVTGGQHVIGIVDVPAGTTAVIRQPRGVDAHTPIVLTAGRWTVRQQTEVTSARVIRRVAD